MPAQGLVARAKKRRRSLTRPDKAAPPAPDLLKRDFAAGAIKMAVAVRGGDVSGVIFHTGRGSEYTADLFEGVCVPSGTGAP